MNKPSWKRVIATDKVNVKLKEIFSKNNIEFKIKTDHSPEELKDLLQGYDGLIIRSKTKITADIIRSLNGRLKVIGRAGIGVDNIDIESATAKGIVVMNTPLGNTITTAELAISMLLSTARQIPYASSTMHQNKWEKSTIKGVEITGKTLGLIGCGNIGTIVCNRAQGLKLKVIVYDPYLAKSKAEQLGVTVVDLDELLKKSDFISLHTPLSQTTKNLIREETILKMKDGIRIVNCARGGIVNEQDLVKYLKKGKIASAALDVFEQEPLPPDNPLMGIPNLILTPHLGASTAEAQERVSLEIAQQISDYLNNGTIVNGYNVFSLNSQEHQKLIPYKKIMTQLGNFISQIRETAYKKITWEFSGEVNNLPSEPLLQAGLKSLLKEVVDSVNEINALHLAKQRGIAIKEIKKQSTLRHQELITLQVQTEKKEFLISSTLFGKVPKIISINGIEIEVQLLKYNLYLENKDEPGFIKEIASVLYQEKINIATFNLARKEKGNKAISLITLDEKPSVDLLKKINQLPLIKVAHFISLD